jgi:hypothetical protein
MRHKFVYLLVIIAFVLRFYGLHNNYPFWVDEFSSGTQAKLILEHGLRVFSDASLLFEFQNISIHFLIAGFFSLFGSHEWVARLPIVIIGSIVPLMVYYLGKELYSKTAGIVAAIFTTFSYFEIVWSQQARGYMLLQLLICSAIYVYLKYIQEGKPSQKIRAGFIVISILGIITHSLFFIVLLAVVIDYIRLHLKQVRSLLKNPLTYILTLGCIVLLYSIGVFKALLSFFSAGFLQANNIGYYHSFLWREYMLVTFLALLGLSLLFLKKNRHSIVVLTYISSHLLFVTFFFGHHMSKYLLPIFPLLLIGAGITIDEISSMLSKNIKVENRKILLAIGITFFIILNGHKFVNRPKAYYSINHDFREISNIDYHQIYKIILDKADKKPAVIETWPSRAYWYLGSNYENLYMFRWENEEGFANGHIKKTKFYIENDMKRISPRIGFVGTVQDLEKIIAKNSVGFLFIDDASLPQDVIHYAEKNLKKELYLDHYPLDDNPYSIWPATLYSWGVQ